MPNVRQEGDMNYNSGNLSKTLISALQANGKGVICPGLRSVHRVSLPARILQYQYEAVVCRGHRTHRNLQLLFAYCLAIS